MREPQRKGSTFNKKISLHESLRGLGTVYEMPLLGLEEKLCPSLDLNDNIPLLTNINQYQMPQPTKQPLSPSLAAHR